MEPLIAHLVGDYLLQSDWMAQEKRRSTVAAACHALAYTLPFLWLTTAPAALAVIAGTHFLIDRFGLARYVVWAKNGIAPVGHVTVRPWAECRTTGYAPTRPDWLTVWLLIAGDNTLHLICNQFALSLG